MNNLALSVALLVGAILMESVSGIEHRWASSPPKEKKFTYNTKWFKQPVDHYNFANEDMFEQRYLINDTWWDHDQGPIFFYTGNEGDIEAFAQNSVCLIELQNMILVQKLSFA